MAFLVILLPAVFVTLLVFSAISEAQSNCVQNAPLILAACQNTNDTATCCALIKQQDPQCICLAISKYPQTITVIASCGVQYDNCSAPAPSPSSVAPPVPSYSNSSTNCSSELSVVMSECKSLQPSCCTDVKNLSPDCQCQGLQLLSSKDASLISTTCKIQYPNCTAPAPTPVPSSPSGSGSPPTTESTTKGAAPSCVPSFAILVAAMLFVRLHNFMQ